MPRYPFGSRPTPRRPQHHQPPVQAPSPPQATGLGGILQNASFSPELSFLLAMTMKDGMNRHTALEMLKKIEPFVSTRDKAAIHSILSAQHLAEDYRRNPPVHPPYRSGAGLSAFSRYSRQQALLDVLSQYAGNDTKSLLQTLSQSARMQENFERMARRMEKLRNMNASSPEQMFEALSMFMPPEEQAKFKNMQNMLHMMNNMGNFRPEDIFKFMGGMGGGAGNMGGMGNMAGMMNRMMGGMGSKGGGPNKK